MSDTVFLSVPGGGCDCDWDCAGGTAGGVSVSVATERHWVSSTWSCCCCWLSCRYASSGFAREGWLEDEVRQGKGWLNAGALPTRWQANKKRQQLNFLVSACWGKHTHTHTSRKRHSSGSQVFIFNEILNKAHKMQRRRRRPHRVVQLTNQIAVAAS